MNAELIGRGLGGRKTGDTWMARCPAHDDTTPSLSIRTARNGIVLVRCHAGCDQEQVIAALVAHGLWDRHGRNRRLEPMAKASRSERDYDARRSDAALRIWWSAQSAANSPVSTYLRERGLKLAVPPAIRFHPQLPHPSGGSWPAMVALVTSGKDGIPVAVHRTFLARDGSGKAEVRPQKMMLGPCSGGVVRLGVPDSKLMVGEGIETCLAVMQSTGCAAWAALSTSGMRTLELPSTINEVVVLADGDAPGEAAAQACGWRWRQQGRRVSIARPPWGTDFNDLLLGRGINLLEVRR